MNAGRLDAEVGKQQLEQVGSQRQQVEASAIEQLIDLELQNRFAGEVGVAVSDADIDKQFADEAVRKEERRVLMIAVEPQVSDQAKGLSDADRGKARQTADKAAAELKAGKAFADVATAYSTDNSKTAGGEIGWVPKDASNLDKPFAEALFAAAVDVPTAVVTGEDGTYRIGVVKEILAEQINNAYQQEIQAAEISIETYRKAIRGDLTQRKLSEKIVADYVDKETPQRRVSQIILEKSAAAAGATAGDEVKSRHILFSPNDSPDAASTLPAEDPAWAKAEQDAKAAYEQLKAAGNTAAIRTKFEALAKTDSDDTGSGANGGDLGYVTQDAFVPEFSAAIFADGLKAGDLLAPVRSSFGWHVIMYEARRPPASEWITQLAEQVRAPGADFAALAKANSDDPEAAANGGEIGWVTRYQLEPQLNKAVFDAAIGSVTEPIDVAGAADGDPGRYYLLKIWEEQTRKPDADKVAELRETVFQSWFQERKETVNVYRDPQFQDQGATTG